MYILSISSYNLLRHLEPLPDISARTNVRVYPNPSAGKITCEYKDALQLQYISITNLLGEEVLKISEPKKEIDISNLPTGLYYLRVETNKGSKTFKLQKE